MAAHALTSMLMAVLLTAVLLVALWAVLDRALWLSMRMFDPLLERSRHAMEQDRILRQLAARQLLQAQAQARQQQRSRVVDLDGRLRWLLPEELRAFQGRCWTELGLPIGTPWPMVRRQWRRRSLAWHPDQGGDPADWLRKQRAYEALETAIGSLPASAAPVSPAPTAIPASRKFRWRRSR